LSFVRTHNLKTARPNFTKLLCMLFVAEAWTSSDGVAICYVLPVLWMTSRFHTMRPVGGRTGTTLYSSPTPVFAGQVRAAAAHWFAGSAGRLVGARRPGRSRRWLSGGCCWGHWCAFRRVLHASSVLRTDAKSAILLPPPKKEVMFLVRSVCLSVCLSVRRITRKLVNGF